MLIKSTEQDNYVSSKYDKHVFVCINSRSDSIESSCGKKGFELRAALIQELSSCSYTNNIKSNYPNLYSYWYTIYILFLLYPIVFIFGYYMYIDTKK